MKIQYLSELDCRFHVRGEQEAGRRWQLIRPFEIQVDGRRWEVPALFWTDFASIPRIVWPIVSPEELGYGSVPHDFGYFTGYESKAYWDEIFMACMELDGIDPWKREKAYEAVERFGHKTWDAYRLQGTSSEQIGRLFARFTTEQQEAIA